jgi:hypothetical protein
MQVWFGLHSGVNGNQGSCVSSLFNPHTGLQQCPICSNLGNLVGMQCPASHPVCCPDGGCVYNATQCTCYANDDCPNGTCCNGNRRASVVAPNPDDSWISQDKDVLYYLTLKGCHLCRSFMTVQLLTCTAAVQRALLLQYCKHKRPPCTSWSMDVGFGFTSGVSGNQGTCVSSVFDPHTGLQQCPTCICPVPTCFVHLPGTNMYCTIGRWDAIYAA